MPCITNNLGILYLMLATASPNIRKRKTELCRLLRKSVLAPNGHKKTADSPGWLSGKPLQVLLPLAENDEISTLLISKVDALCLEVYIHFSIKSQL
jgi:hypothetical protein